jgi:hypothetical protein
MVGHEGARFTAGALVVSPPHQMQQATLPKCWILLDFGIYSSYLA